MQEFRTMLSTQCLLLLYMALGFLVSRLGLLSAEGRRTLTNLAMDVFLPCSIFNSFSTAIGADQVRSALTILALAAAALARGRGGARWWLAGGVALFAPCCIVFLAPSYMAGAVKNRRWRLLPLTFVFAAGLALVLVPITLGVRLVA